MKPAIRTTFQFLPIMLQGAGVAAALGIISFIVPVTTRLIKEAEGKTPIPTPSRLLVEHAGAAKLAIVVLFAISVVTFVVTRSKMKEEADRLIVQGQCSVWSGMSASHYLVASSWLHCCLTSRSAVSRDESRG